MNRKNIGTKAGAVLFYVAIILVFIAPVIRLVIMGFKGTEGYGFSNYSLLLRDKRTMDAVRNTLVISVSSTLIATAAGSLLAFVAAYTNIRRKRLLELLVLMPFIIPSYIITLSWSGLLSKRGMINRMLEAVGAGAADIYTIEGIILVMGICNIPVVYMSVIHMLRKIPVDMEWASRACGFGTWRTLVRINLVQALPAIVSGSILAFLSAIDNFSVPAFLGISSGIPVLSTYIYEKAIGFGPNAFPLAAALSVILSLMAVGGTLLEGILIRKRSAMESIREDYSVRITLKPGQRRAVEWGLLASFGFLNIVPLISMISSAFLKVYGLKMSRDNFSLKNFQFIFANRGVMTAVRNSLLLAVITCVVCMAAGTAIAYLKMRKGSRAMGAAEKCASLTYAIPGIVLSLAMIFHWVEPIAGFRPGIYGTIHILVIAYITRYLILQIKGSTTALLAVDPALEEAVRASGRGKLDLWFKVLAPLIMRPVLAGSFLIFVSSLTELTLSSMLASAGTKTIGLSVFNFQQSGDYHLAAAMSAVIVVLILAGYCLINLKSEPPIHVEEQKNEPVSGTCNTEVRPNFGA